MNKPDNLWRHRRPAVLIIAFLIAALHIFGPGRYLQGGALDLYYSFFSDITIPFGCYFLLYAVERHIPFLSRRGVKAAVAFLLPSTAETLQFIGIALLGATFDPLDYLAYFAGASSALLLDTLVLKIYHNPG